jgi:HprK-related kinase B
MSSVAPGPDLDGAAAGAPATAPGGGGIAAGGLAPGVETPLDLWLRFADVAVHVATNTGAVRDALGRYYAPYLSGPSRAPAVRVRLVQGAVPPPASVRDVVRGGRRVKEAVVDVGGGRLILKRQTGVVMGLWPGRAEAAGDLAEHLNQAINLVNACYAKIVMERGHRLLHASAVLRGDRAIVLAGVPGAGKSTAALHLVEAGFAFLSNDRVLARATEADVAVLGYPKQPRVNPGTLLTHPRLAGLLEPDDRQALHAMGRQALWALERKRDVDLDAIYGPGTVRLSGRMTALVLLAWRLDGQGLEVRRLDPGEARARHPIYAKDLGAFDLDRPAAAPDAGPGRYDALLARVPVLEVTGAPDFRALVSLVTDLIDR